MKLPSNFKYLLWFAALVPMFLLRDFTPANELRYLLIADDAIRDGHVFAFYLDGAVYADKPPLYLWIVMLGKLLWGHHSLLWLSLFSVLPAFVILHIMDKWVSRELAPQWRTPAQMALLSTAFFLGGMAVLRMDMLMSMFIVLSLHTFYRIYTGEAGKGALWLLPLYVFLALFTKGPYGVLIPLLGIVTFLLVKRKPRKIAHVLSWRFWLVLASLAIAWFGCVYLEGGKEYLNDLLFNQTAGRAVNSFSHSRGFFFYFYSFFYAFAPWCLLYLGALVIAIVKKHKFSDLELLFLSIVGSSFLVLSLVSAKLEIYMLPVYPFVAYLGFLLLQHIGSNRWTKAFVAFPAIIFLISLPSILVLPHFVESFGMLRNPFIWAAGVVLLVSGVVAMWAIYKKSDEPMAIDVVGGGLYLTLFVASFFVPSINNTLGYGELAKEAMKVAESQGIEHFVSYKVKRVAGMRVYLGARVDELEWDELVASTQAVSDGNPAESKFKADGTSILLLSNGAIGREPELQKLLEGRDVHKVGDTSFVVW